MRRTRLVYFMLPLLLLWSISSADSEQQAPAKNQGDKVGTRERLMLASASITLRLDVNRLAGRDVANEESKFETIRFEAGQSSFFTVRLANDVLRGADTGMLWLSRKNAQLLPEPLNAAANHLVVERLPAGEPFELAVRDEKSGFTYFNIEGHLYDYNAASHLLTVDSGRLLVSEDLANKLGRSALSGTTIGDISITATMYPIEVTTLVNDVVQSTVMPPRKPISNDPNGGAVPGPDIVVGDMSGLAQFGSASGQVGLGIGATSCNNGSVPVNFIQLPDPDHSVVSQNLYRMSGGTTNNDRLEQIGQAWVKHTFGASQDNACGFGCTPNGDDQALGVGCSDPYAASQNASQTNHEGALGSRAWVNPFTGAFSISPRPENHTGHTHTGTSHRILVNSTDLNTTMNTGATYYAEVQYDSPHEFAWCQAHAGECNMYNNASYRRYNVSGTTSFTFAAAATTVRMQPATAVWAGSTSVTVEPAPGIDGRAFVVYKVTNPSAGVWHYEYAIHNSNLDRSIQSFSVPVGTGAAVSNVGFHAPPNHPGFPNDGTLNNAGFSNTPWTPNQGATDMSWSTETFAQNQNANAIRFGTMYNFRFDSDQAPQTATATVGFFKTGEPITVQIQAPGPVGGVTPSPTPQVSPTETPEPNETPTATPEASPSVSPGETPTPSPSPTGTVQALNLSTRLVVGTGNNVGIGGFIITGAAPKQVLLRGIGPSLTIPGVNVLPDPLLELNGENGFQTIINNNWKDTQEAAIQATGIAPTNDLESAILVTLNPGSYTAILKGNADVTGTGLVEIYDLTPGASEMGNISTRAFVNTGNDIVIAGFILGNGSDPELVILRALGVDLGGPQLDPRLELRDSSGTLLASNDSWQSDPEQAAIITAAGLALSNPTDAAIAATLAPGAYTGLLLGANNTTGVGLVEAYNNPVSGPTPTPGATPTPGGETPTPTPPIGPTPTPVPPTPTPGTTVCTENFDGVTAPALPAGWVASNPTAGDGVMFVTTTNMSDSAPNNAFIPDQDGISDKVLDRQMTINSASPVLTFRNNFNSEFSDGIFWDGGVLEISAPNISGGDFLDVTDSHVGGSITSGGYTGEISGDASNPLAGRMAWSGNSGGYIDTVINLGPNLNGQTITLRFRFGSDEAEPAAGWHIDGLSIDGASCQ